MWISINISGWFADKVREKSWLNTSQTRKTFNSIGLLSYLQNILSNYCAILTDLILVEKLQLNCLKTFLNYYIFLFVGLIGPAIFLVFCSLVGCNQSAAIACICAATSLNAFVYSGCNANHIDLSPK